jgi:hypothetical protein
LVFGVSEEAAFWRALGSSAEVVLEGVAVVSDELFIENLVFTSSTNSPSSLLRM